MPTTPIGEPISHNDAETSLSNFQQFIAPAFYQESIAFSISVLKQYLIDAEKELRKLRSGHDMITV